MKALKIDEKCFLFHLKIKDIKTFVLIFWSCRKNDLIKKIRLKVESCKLDNNKYMIASTQITSTELFTSIVVLVCKLLSRKVLFINRKDNRNC